MDGYFDWEALDILEAARDISVETLGLSGLFLSESPLCAATAGEQVWARLSSVMDSGACAPVAPPSMAPHVPVVPSPGSVRGQVYNTAAKEKIPTWDSSTCMPAQWMELQQMLYSKSQT